MIDFIEGKIIKKFPTKVVLQSGGMGFDIVIPLSSFDRLPIEGNNVRLLTHIHIREDNWQIYGFYTEDERGIFRNLISVSGVGPKGAISVLSGIGAEEFKRAVLSKDLKALTSVSGIGKKTAERVIVELKDKFKALADVSVGVDDSAMLSSGNENDAVLALVSLGYSRDKAEKAVRKAFELSSEKGLTVEELVRLALKNI